LLLLLIAEAEGLASEQPDRAGLTLAELYGPDSTKAEPEQPRTRWRSITRLWHAQLNAKEWNSLLDVIRLGPVPPPDASVGGTAPQLWVTRWKPADHDQPISGRALLPHLPPPDMAALDATIWLESPAGQALREAALLDSPGYQDSCAALLPYRRALGGPGRAARFQLGEWATGMIALLVSSTEEDARAHLYIRLFNQSWRLGPRQARLVLSRLRDDIHRLSPAELADIARQASRYAWTNITAYLDILAHIHTPIQERTARCAARYRRTATGRVTRVRCAETPKPRPPHPTATPSTVHTRQPVDY
jgi:hypothetical protein